jgi:hypothetical protein
MSADMGLHQIRGIAFFALRYLFREQSECFLNASRNSLTPKLRSVVSKQVIPRSPTLRKA